MNTSRHHHISPLALALVMAVGGVIGCVRADYFKDAFHQDILATINPADVLTPADMVPEQPAGSGPDRTVTASLR